MDKQSDIFHSGLSAFAETRGNNIKLTLYDGSVVNHWYWGNMAFDLNGIKLAKTPLPILLDHDTDRRVGVGHRLTIEGGRVVLHGQLLNNSDAEAIKADAMAGFPFEASLRFDDQLTQWEAVGEGESREVNGVELIGPGTVFTETIIKEGSVCTFGALAGTTAEFNGDTYNEFVTLCGGDVVKAREAMKLYLNTKIS